MEGRDTCACFAAPTWGWMALALQCGAQASPPTNPAASLSLIHSTLGYGIELCAQLTEPQRLARRHTNDLHVLHERNAHMAGRVLELAREAPSGRVLLVTGMNHVPGLLYALHHPGCTPAAGQPCAACAAHQRAEAAQAKAADEAWEVNMPASPW